LKADDEQVFSKIYFRHWQPMLEAAYHRQAVKKTAKELANYISAHLKKTPYHPDTAFTKFFCRTGILS